MISRAALAAGVAAGLTCLALLLSGCGRNGASVPAAGGGPASDQTDPALTDALEDQIMVDPTLSQQRTGATRPGSAPGQAPIPAIRPAPGGPAIVGLRRAPAPGPGRIRPATTLGELAGGTVPDCTRNVRYGMAWAQRLPAALPLFPDAQVREAAGNDVPGCDIRVVSFASGAPVDRLVDFYYTYATRAGYDAEHQLAGTTHILGGDRDADAFYATFRARQGGGTEVDLVTNAGR